MYLQEQLRDHQVARTLRSTTPPLFYRPFVSTIFASRAFYFPAPQVWNCLWTSTRSANTFGSFRRCLKSQLFAGAYDTKALRALLIRFATRRYTNLSSIVRTTVLLKSLECYKNTQMKAKHHTSNLLAVVCGTMCLQAACKLFAYRTPLI